MKPNRSASACALILLYCCFSVGAGAQTSIPGVSTTATSGSSSYEGRVSQTSPDGFTIMSRYGDRAIAVKTDANTQYKVTTGLTQDQLEVGQIVLVIGKVDATKQEVQAALIYVASGDERSGSGARRGQAGQGAKAGKRLIGKITAVSPDLTIATRDGSYTLLMLPRTMIVTRSEGSAEDIKAGTMVTVVGSATGDLSNQVITATEVSVKSGVGYGTRGSKLQNVAPTDSAQPSTPATAGVAL